MAKVSANNKSMVRPNQKNNDHIKRGERAAKWTKTDPVTRDVIHKLTPLYSKNNSYLNMLKQGKDSVTRPNRERA